METWASSKINLRHNEKNLPTNLLQREDNRQSGAALISPLKGTVAAETPTTETTAGSWLDLQKECFSKINNLAQRTNEHWSERN